MAVRSATTGVAKETRKHLLAVEEPVSVGRLVNVDGTIDGLVSRLVDEGKGLLGGKIVRSSSFNAGLRGKVWGKAPITKGGEIC